MLGSMVTPRSPRVEARPTLSHFGSMVPRPGGAAQCSPRLPVGAGDHNRPRTRKQMDSLTQIPAATHAATAPAQPGSFGSFLGSPRLSPRVVITDSRAPTLGQFGAMLPRPSAYGPPIGSPRLSPRVVQPISAPHPGSTPKVSSRSLHQQPPPDTRSGVVYERDGYEVFYGVGTGKDGEAARPTQGKRDGFDRFYGIRSQDKQPANKETAGEKTASPEAHAVAPENNARQPTQQSAAGYPTTTTQRQAVAPGGKLVPPMQGFPGGQLRQQVKAPVNQPAVPTYSVATPVPSFVPPVDSALPKGVDVFSVATPMPPPPVVPSLQM